MTFLLLVLNTIPSFSQNSSVINDEIQWNVAYIEEETSVYKTETFTVFYAKKIEWRDQHGNIKYTFNINQVIGVWSDPNVDGAIRYDFDFENNKGSVDIRRKGQAISIEVMFANHQRPLSFSLPVTDFIIL